MTDRDPTRVTSQKALTTSSGRSWLVTGGLLALIAVVMLVVMRDLKPEGATVAGIAIIVPLYLLMVVVRYAVPPGRVRLILLAVLTLLVCAAFFVFAGIMAVTAAQLTPVS